MPAIGVVADRFEGHGSRKSDHLTWHVSPLLQPPHRAEEAQLIGVLGSKAVYQIRPGTLSSAATLH